MEEAHINEFKPDLTLNEFRVNKWMVRLGFKWQFDDPGSNLHGRWSKDGHAFTQIQAIVWYKSVKRWWKFWM